MIRFLARVLTARALWHWHPARDLRPITRTAGFHRLARYALVFDAVTFVLLVLTPLPVWAVGSLVTAAALAVIARARR